MSLDVITQEDLIRGTVNYLAESTTEGTIETSGTMLTVGPVVRFSQTHGRSKLVSTHAGTENLRIVKYPGGQIGATTIVFKLIDTGFIKYITSSQDGTTATTTYSVSLAADISVHGTTKYWLAEFARPGFGLISSGRDQEVIGLGTFSHKFDRPLGTTWTSKPTLSNLGSETDYPTWEFSDGGDNPVTWDGDGLDCEAIRIMVDKMPLVRTSAGASTLKINKCTGKRVRFRLTIGNDSYAQNLIDDHANGNTKTMIWTVNLNQNPVAELRLDNCGLDPIPEEFLSSEENPEVQLNLSGEATNLTWSKGTNLSNSFTIS